MVGIIVRLVARGHGLGLGQLLAKIDGLWV